MTGTSSALAVPAKARLSLSEMALAALFCVLWASAFSAAKFALADSPPLILLTARFLIAGGIMLALAAASGLLSSLARRDVGLLILLGVLNNALYLGPTWVGVQTVSSAFAAILISTNPILVAFLAAVVLGERLTWLKLAGLALGVVGIGIVLRSRLGGIEDPFGAALVGCGLVSMVAGTVLFKRLKPGGGLWVGSAVQFLAAGLAVLPVALATETLGDVHYTARLGLSLAYIVIATSIGAYYLWFRLLTRSSATAAASLHFLMPPLGLLFGWLVLGEPVALADLIGIVPIALGIAMVTRS